MTKYRVIMEFEVDDIFTIASNNLDRLRQLNSAYEIVNVNINKVK